MAVKRLGSLISKESELIHSPFHGELIAGREAVNAKIKTQNTGWNPVILHTYSPFGVEFINTPELNIKQGDNISIRVNLAGDETLFDGLVVNNSYVSDGISIVGVRTFIRDKKTDLYSGRERRTKRRWSCSDDFLPTGMAPNPVKYNDYVLFRVEDISRGGLKLITSMRNKFLGIGQKLECKLSIPYVGSVGADVVIKYIDTAFYREREFMVLGVEFTKTDPILLKSLGEYLLNFAKDITVKNLNSEGFGLKSVSKWLDFSYVKTEEEYKKVLELRYKAYQSVGKIEEEAQKEDMANELDSKAKILIAKHDGKIVGSLAYFMPTESSQMLISHDVKYPENFPEITEVVEGWRLCVDSSFRKVDVTNSLILYLILSIIKNERRYLYTSASAELISFYKKIGFKITNMTYKNKPLNNIEHKIIIMDTYDVVNGKNIGPVYWNKIYRRLHDYMFINNKLELTLGDRARIWIYKKIGLILNIE